MGAFQEHDLPRIYVEFISDLNWYSINIIVHLMAKLVKKSYQFIVPSIYQLEN